MSFPAKDSLTLSESLDESLKGLTLEQATEFLWNQGDLSYLLDDLQLRIRREIYEAIDRGARKICILSSRQIGKSYLGLVLAIESCIRRPGIIVRFASNTLKQVTEIVADNFAPISREAPQGMIERLKSDARWIVGKSSLRLGSLERANVDNNRGGNASIVILEEGGFLPSEDYKYAIESVIGPQLIRSNGIEIHITTVSEDEFHYIHSVVKPQCELLQTFFKYNVYDSPSLSDEQIAEAAKRSGGYESESFRREYMAEIIRSSTLMVVPEFDDSSHVGEFELPEHYRSCVAIDFGGTQDHTVGLLTSYDFKRDKVLFVDEIHFGPNTTTDEIIKAAKVMEANVNWFGKDRQRWGDVQGQTQNDIIQVHKYPIRLPEKHDSDAHINLFRLGFTQGKILIHPRCKFLIGTLKHARYNDKRTDFLRSDLWGHADAIMAGVYAYRMVDKTTNPYPPSTISRDYQLHVPGRTRPTNELANIAKALIPYNPMQRAGKVKS